MNREIISYETFIINELLFYKDPISVDESCMIRTTINNSHLPFMVDEEKDTKSKAYECLGLTYLLRDINYAKQRSHIKLSTLFKKMSSYEEEKIRLKKSNQN